jgi:hypothetical protein
MPPFFGNKTNHAAVINGKILVLSLNKGSLCLNNQKNLLEIFCAHHYLLEEAIFLTLPVVLAFLLFDNKLI